ncbi:MAG TPA: hypothetical protein PLI31_09410 [Methanoregulaceae archaeon]|nr:hypothetical protein [Methanoregulaceae archaeon]
MLLGRERSSSGAGPFSSRLPEQASIAGSCLPAGSAVSSNERTSPGARRIQTCIDDRASCSTFRNYAVNYLVVRYPRSNAGAAGRVGIPKRWMRRAAALSLVVPARPGACLQKASRNHRQGIFDCMLRPRTAQRYAIAPMPPGMRGEAMRGD